MLIVSTLAFTVRFMVWMLFGVIGIPLKKSLGLNATEFGLLTATPVLTGSLIRVPLGIWTNKYGGRIVMTLLMAITVPAILLMSYATAYWHFLVIGLFVGLAGGSFSVGTPYVARWFPRNRQGMAMGVYGAGNSGSAVNKFAAPALLLLGRPGDGRPVPDLRSRLFLEPGELPDHLTVVLQYASTQPPAQAKVFLGEITHMLQVIFSALLRREAGHACVLAALLDLAGEKAQAVAVAPEPELDESWAEPGTTLPLMSTRTSAWPSS